MFDRLKKVFSRPEAGTDVARAAEAAAPAAPAAVAAWARSRGWRCAASADGSATAVDGLVRDHKWLLEVGPSTRRYNQGQELRARAELGLQEDLRVIVVSNTLKNALEEKAFAAYTDTLQTSMDSNMPEEMRWLMMYDEVPLDGLPEHFPALFSVHGSDEATPAQWVDPALARALVAAMPPRPEDAPPFLMMLLRGKLYLRMACDPGDTATLQAASGLFLQACEAALDRLPKAGSH